METSFSRAKAEGWTVISMKNDRDAILVILGPGSADIISSGNATEDKAVPERIRASIPDDEPLAETGDGSELLMVGSDNQAFPVALVKNAVGQWYFDVTISSGAFSGHRRILAGERFAGRR
jgi:hypothetical protein